MLPLPGYDKHGRKVILQRLSLIDPTRCKPEDAMRVNAMITETFFEQADFQSQVSFFFLCPQCLSVVLLRRTF